MPRYKAREIQFGQRACPVGPGDRQRAVVCHTVLREHEMRDLGGEWTVRKGHRAAIAEIIARQLQPREPSERRA